MSNITYPCYWLKKDASGGWYWIYYASNGKAIARTSESYVRKDDCIHAMNLLKGSANDTWFYDL